MRGETVVVERRERVGSAPGNTPIYDWVAESVHDVLVAPGPRTDVVDSIRPDGVKVVWNLHFPKTFNASLKACRVRVRGEAPCAVIGDPKPYTLANTPTRWWMPVEVEAVNG